MKIISNGVKFAFNSINAGLFNAGCNEHVFSLNLEKKKLVQIHFVVREKRKKRTV